MTRRAALVLLALLVPFAAHASDSEPPCGRDPLVVLSPASGTLTGPTTETFRVISQRGMMAALALRTSTSGAWLPRFLGGERIARYVGDELREKVGKPLRFQWSPLVSNQPQMMVHGYDAAILIDICPRWLLASPDRLWSMGDLVALIDAWDEAQPRQKPGRKPKVQVG